MLVLSRKPGERLVVPHSHLVVTVLAVEGKAVRLGISAPAEVVVLREELLRRERSDGVVGAQSSSPADRQ